MRSLDLAVCVEILEELVCSGPRGAFEVVASKCRDNIFFSGLLLSGGRSRHLCRKITGLLVYIRTDIHAVLIVMLGEGGESSSLSSSVVFALH